MIGRYGHGDLACQLHVFIDDLQAFQLELRGDISLWLIIVLNMMYPLPTGLYIAWNVDNSLEVLMKTTVVNHIVN